MRCEHHTILIISLFSGGINHNIPVLCLVGEITTWFELSKVLGQSTIDAGTKRILVLSIHQLYGGRITFDGVGLCTFWHSRIYPLQERFLQCKGGLFNSHVVMESKIVYWVYWGILCCMYTGFFWRTYDNFKTQASIHALYWGIR